MRASAVLFLCSFAAACGQVDPCARTVGACISVRVTSESALRIDELDVTAIGAFAGMQTSTLSGGASLPVRIGVIPPAGATMGELTFNVTGLSAGKILGNGSVTHTLSANDRSEIEVVLSSMSNTDMGSMSSDLAGADLAGADLAVTTCVAGTPIACGGLGASLMVCNGTGTGVDTVSCDYNCADGPPPHCKVFTPHSPVTAMTLATAGTGTPTFTGTIKFNTDDGTIDGVRLHNNDATTAESISGIVFVRTGVSGVFSMTNATFDENAMVSVVGSGSLVIVATNNVIVHGIIDARAHDAGNTLCPLPNAAASAGGFAGGVITVNGGTGGGMGGGKPTTVSGLNGGGSGGGGYGDAARAGGPGFAAGYPGGVGGGEVPLAAPIVGGSGGGSGLSSDNGGAGGGAVQLVAGVMIQIGGGTLLTANGINVSGCGGTGGIMESAGAGGGAGGTILIEAPDVEIGDFGALVSNGGGGGGGNNFPGATSALSGNAALGGMAGGGYAGGGEGGAYNFAPGNPGNSGTSANPAGGGSGGAVGRIIVLNRSGSLVPAATSVISPKFGLTSQLGNPIALMGTINTL